MLENYYIYTQAFYDIVLPIYSNRFYYDLLPDNRQPSIWFMDYKIHKITEIKSCAYIYYILEYKEYYHSATGQAMRFNPWCSKQTQFNLAYHIIKYELTGKKSPNMPKWMNYNWNKIYKYSLEGRYYIL